jgi:hypothetical protein
LRVVFQFDDAKAILSGPQDAATQYFRRVTETNLYTRFLPIVQQATAKCGVTSAYKNMMAKLGTLPCAIAPFPPARADPLVARFQV